MKNGLLITGLLLLLFSCGKRSLNPADYMKYIESEKSGLLMSKAIGAYTFTVLYKPAEYMAIQSGISGEAEIKKKSESFQAARYFTFRMEMGKDQMDNQAESERLKSFFSFVSEQDFSLEIAGKTYPCLMCLPEQTNGLSPYYNILLAFDVPETCKGDMIFCFKGEYINTGPVNFKFPEERVNELPIIK